MSDMIKNFNYSKVSGRGRGILGLSEAKLCRKPGACANAAENAKNNPSNSPKLSSNGSVGASKTISPTVLDPTKVLIAMHTYKANPDAPGGFTELSIRKGQILCLYKEHPENEHWWEVKNEDGDIGFIPSSYVLIREEQSLPWLQLSSLKTEEQERKERVKRLSQQKSAADGVGFGPTPKNVGATLAPKPYISAYPRSQDVSSAQSDPDRHYCSVCDKRLNGPKPFGAHMASKAHKDELALLENP